MAIVRRSKVWQVQVRVGKDAAGKWVRKSATCSSKAEAEKAERRLLAEAEGNRRRFVEPTQETLGTFLDGYLEREAARLRPRTQTLYSTLLRCHVRPALGDVPLADLSPRKVQAFYSSMGAKRVTQQVRAFLVVALKQAEELGMVATNAAKRAKAPYLAPNKRTSFTLAEAKSVLAAAAGTRYVQAMAIALYTGLRRGEILGLRWEDIAWDVAALTVRRQVNPAQGGVIVQEPKTAAGVREVPLVPQAVTALKAQRVFLARENGATPATGWVFPTATGRPLYPNHLTDSFHDAVKRAGAPNLPLHSLRHTTASLLLSAGVPAEQAAKILGHKSLAVFYRTYADLLRPGAQDAAKRLTDYLAAQDAAAPKVAAMSANVSANSMTAPGNRSGSKRNS